MIVDCTVFAELLTLTVSPVAAEAGSIGGKALLNSKTIVVPAEGIPADNSVGRLTVELLDTLTALMAAKAVGTESVMFPGV